VAWTVTYEGTAASLTSLAATLQSQGARTSLSTPAGGFSTLTVQWSKDPTVADSAEVANDVWSLNGEPYQVSIFSLPAIRAEAQEYGNVADYRRSIDDAVNAGEDFPLDASTYPLGLAAYKLLTSGTEYFELTRPSLSRTRTYSLTYTGARTSFSPYQFVYTRASLISTFAVPSSTQVQIPADPTETPPAGMTWGWRLKGQSYNYTREKLGTKVEEVLEWDFAAWFTSPVYGQSLYVLV